jgi:hypothetical protein
MVRRTHSVVATRMTAPTAGGRQLPVMLHPNGGREEQLPRPGIIQRHCSESDGKRPKWKVCQWSRSSPHGKARRMSNALREPLSLTDFLDWEERQELPYEFDGSQPVAMTGGTDAHEAIGGSLRSRSRRSGSNYR